MQQTNFLFVTGFSSKPDILQRNHSFLNNPQQSGSSQDNQNKKNKVDFVQKNKIIIKLQKTDNNNGQQKLQIPIKGQHSVPQKISISKRLNQSVGLVEDSQELNSEIMKLSSSFDFKMMKAKRILRRIVPKDQQYPGRSHSSMDKFVEESNENQTKFRTNYQKFEQDKENHDINLNTDSIKGGSSNESCYQGNDRFNQISNSFEIKPSSSLRNINYLNQSQGMIGIKCATQPDFEQEGGDIKSDDTYILDMIKQQDTIQRLQQQNPQKTVHDIVKDSYFNQDNKQEYEDQKQLQNLIQEAKKKCPDIKHIVNQSLGVPNINIQDISLKDGGGKKPIKVIRKSTTMEQNLIDAYNNNKQNILNNPQIRLQQTQSQMNNNQTLMELKKSNDNDSHSTITFNQKSTIDETLPSASNANRTIQSNDMSKQQVHFETLIKQEEERIRASKLKERNQSNLSMSLDTYEQNEQQQKKQSNSQLSTQVQSYQNSQIEPGIQNIQFEYQQQQQQVQDPNNFKHQHRVLHRNYDYQIGIKGSNISTNNGQIAPNQTNQMSEKLMIQHQIYSPSPNNPILSTQNASITDKSAKSNASNQNNQKGIGQFRQNLVLFYNNKKKDINMNTQGSNTNQFQMETVQESGFQPQNIGKSPFKQNTKQIVISMPQSKKFNFNATQTQQNIMNAYLDVNTRMSTEPIQSTQNITQYNQYTPLSIQKKTNQQTASTISNQRSQQGTGHFNNFLEEFNLDSISIGANQPMTKSSSKSRRTPNHLTYQLEISSKTGTTPLSLQNKSNAAIKNAMRYQSNSQHSSYNNPNQNNQNQNYVKSASSLGFNENEQQYYHHNIISNPPLLSLSQDGQSDGTNSTKHIPFAMYGNSMPVANSTQSRQSGGTGGQNMIFEFHEVKQQPYNYRSLSQQSNRSNQNNFNLSVDRSSQQGTLQRNLSNHNNLNQLQNFQPSTLSFAPASCSSSQSLYSQKQSTFQNKLNQSLNGASSKNLIGEFNSNNIMREMYTELDEDVRIFDFSPKRIQSLKQNQLQRSTIMSSTSLLDFNNTTLTGSQMSKTNGIPLNQINEFKQYNEISKNCISKLDSTNKPNETNQVINQYLDSVRTRITQLKNKKKNTEIDLILLNSKVIQEIEYANTHLKQKMPHHLNQQIDDLYQQIKKNIFIYSCQ